VREGILPLYPTLLRPPRESCVQLWPSAQDRPGPGGAGPEEAPAITRGLEHFCWEDRLGEQGLVSLEKRRLRGDLRAAPQYLKGTGFSVGPVATGQGFLTESG